MKLDVIHYDRYPEDDTILVINDKSNGDVINLWCEASDKFNHCKDWFSAGAWRFKGATPKNNQLNEKKL